MNWQDKEENETFERSRDRIWFSSPSRKVLCENCGTSLLDIARTFFNIGFSAGSSWGIRRTSRISPHIAKFVELMIWLAVNDDKFADRLSVGSAKNAMMALLYDPEIIATIKLTVLGEIISHTEQQTTTDCICGHDPQSHYSGNICANEDCGCESYLQWHAAQGLARTPNLPDTSGEMHPNPHTGAACPYCIPD